MIKFRVSFLLAFSLLPPHEEPKKAKNKDKRGKSKDKKSKGYKKDKKSRTSKKGGRKSKEEEEGPPKPDYLLECGSPIGYAHIEYELLPGRPKEAVDVVCWNKVAKVFAGDDSLTFKGKIVDNKIWVPIYVKHYVNNLQTESLVQLHGHAITFTIATNRKKLGPTAKSENAKEFYIRREHVDLNDIVLAYPEDPNLVQSEIFFQPYSSIADDIKEIIYECIYKPGSLNADEIVTRLKLEDPIHTFRMNEIIKKAKDHGSMHFHEYIHTSLAPATDVEEAEEKRELLPRPKKEIKEKGNRKDKKAKKEKKGKKRDAKGSAKSRSRKGAKAEGTLQIKVNAEVFFTNPVLVMFDLKRPNRNITDGYVLFSVERLLTRQQKYELNPMTIRIRKIDNLPVDILKQHKFKSIFVRYNIPFIARGKTLEKDLREKVRVCEAHAHFTTDIPKIKLMEFLENRRLHMEICGIKEEALSREIPANLFGQEENDKSLSKRFTPQQVLHKLKAQCRQQSPTVVTLAVACYDLNSLLIPTWDYMSNETCHNPDNMQFQLHRRKCYCYDPDFLTPGNINLKVPCKPKSGSPLTESLLMEHNTSLKIEVSFGAPPVHPLCDVITAPEYYNRMFIIIEEFRLAGFLLNELLVYSQALVKSVVAKSPLERIEEGELKGGDWMSGFMIDNGGLYSFFLECKKENMNNVWKTFMTKSAKQMKVFYNVNNAFEDRLYEDLLPIGGVYTITLVKPLRDILREEKIYIEGSVPLPCWQALKKLDLLYRCFTIKDMVQYSFFPTSEELYSLNLEWGVPLRWKEEDVGMHTHMKKSSTKFY